jgi:hypothetical protein
MPEPAASNQYGDLGTLTVPGSVRLGPPGRTTFNAAGQFPGRNHHLPAGARGGP